MNIYELLDYDAWATAKLLEAVESLSLEQFVQEYAGSFSSARQQFVHLLSVTDRYRARLAQKGVPDLSPESFATPQDLIIYEAQVRGHLNDFITGLNDNSLGQVVEHMTRKGLFQATVSQTLQHMVNHATYHRGQIACLLKLHGVDFADTDFIIWINQKHDK
ncbi:MAG TPA: DinB family protein [Abditibacteriaceae bacterium]|jgi:uncharacterized damage-inducible protein DinB